MRKFLLLIAVFILGFMALGQIRVLVVDESEGLGESLRLLAVIRALKATGFFVFQALQKFPTERWEGEPFQVAIYLPAKGPYVWLCSPWPETGLPEEFRLALARLREAFTQAFSPLREVRGPEKDLYPLLLTVSLASLGYLGGR
ncbi:hypothetical protein H5T57_04805 [Candidatus Bipolaricaulota bacterium]|nr:hypothetical protein [Candidatus Bipolaricaulota bacterium]